MEDSDLHLLRSSIASRGVQIAREYLKCAPISDLRVQSPPPLWPLKGLVYVKEMGNFDNGSLRVSIVRYSRYNSVNYHNHRCVGRVRVEDQVKALFLMRKCL